MGHIVFRGSERQRGGPTAAAYRAYDPFRMKKLPGPAVERKGGGGMEKECMEREVR